jgi:hypothetical protein
MIMIKIQIFEQSRPIDTYKISKNNIKDGIGNMISYLQEKGWLDENVCNKEKTQDY